MRDGGVGGHGFKLQQYTRFASCLPHISVIRVHQSMYDINVISLLYYLCLWN